MSQSLLICGNWVLYHVYFSHKYLIKVSAKSNSFIYEFYFHDGGNVTEGVGLLHMPYLFDFASFHYLAHF